VLRWNGSDRFEVEGVEGESFELFLQLDVVFLASKILKFNLLEHVVGEKGDAVASLEVALADVC
jgi:hypothetical protein